MVTVYVFGLDETCRSQVITFRPVHKDQLKFIHICTWYNVCASAHVCVCVWVRVRKDQLKFIHICTWYNVCASARVCVGGGMCTVVLSMWDCHLNVLELLLL